jgi:hypothetical protein
VKNFVLTDLYRIHLFTIFQQERQSFICEPISSNLFRLFGLFAHKELNHLDCKYFGSDISTVCFFLCVFFFLNYSDEYFLGYFCVGFFLVFLIIGNTVPNLHLKANTSPKNIHLNNLKKKTHTKKNKQTKTNGIIPYSY